MDREFENKLYAEIKDLLPKVKGAHTLSNHDAQTAINNTFLTIVKKMTDGIVPATVYEDYKGYMYITLMNHTLRCFENNAKFRNSVELISRDNHGEEETSNTLENKFVAPVDEPMSIKHIHALINKLTSRDKELLQLRIEGHTEKEISHLTGLSIGMVGYYTENALTWLKQALNGNNAKPPCERKKRKSN